MTDSTSYTYRDKAKRPKVEAKQRVLKISLFSAGVTGDLYTCTVCKQIFGSARELKLHSGKDHDSFNLSKVFASNSRRDATGKVCGKLNFYLKYCADDMFSRFFFNKYYVIFVLIFFKCSKLRKKAFSTNKKSGKKKF